MQNGCQDFKEVVVAKHLLAVILKRVDISDEQLIWCRSATVGSGSSEISLRRSQARGVCIVYCTAGLHKLWLAG